MRKGGRTDCLNNLKRGWNRKEERGSKDFKKGGGKLGQGVGGLKRGAGTPLRTMTKNVCQWFLDRYK